MGASSLLHFYSPKVLEYFYLIDNLILSTSYGRMLIYQLQNKHQIKKVRKTGIILSFYKIIKLAFNLNLVGII